MTAETVSDSDSTIALGRQRYWQACSVLVLLGVGLVVPAVGTGLAMDDYLHRDFIRAHLSGGGAGQWWQLFGVPLHGPRDVLAAIHIGLVPWWASMDLSMALFRPLAAATHYLDYEWWPTQPALMHVHNLLWYAGLLIVLAIFFRNLWGQSYTALVALLLYAVDEAHVEGAAWIAGRNTVMTAFFVVACLVCHHSAVTGARRWAAYLSPLMLGLALLSSEGAIATWAYLVPYTLLLDRRSLRDRIIGLIPAILITAAWMIAYASQGYGMHGTGTYVSPTDLAQFLSVLPERWLCIMRDQFLLPAIWLMHQSPQHIEQLNALSLVVGCGLLAVAWPYLRRSRTLAFCLVGAALSALPICAASPAPPRLLFLTAVGAFGFLAELATCLTQDQRKHRPLRVRAGLGLATSGLVLLMHVPVALALTGQAAHEPRRTQRVTELTAAGLPWGPELVHKTLIVLNTPNYFVSTVARWVLHPPGPITIQTLCSSKDEVRIHRTSINEFEIVPDGGFLREPWTKAVRPVDQPFSLGFRAAVGPFWVEVTELADDGRPARLRVVGFFLDNGPYVYCYWESSTNQCRITPIPKTGETLIIPPYMPQ